MMIKQLFYCPYSPPYIGGVEFMEFWPTYSKLHKESVMEFMEFEFDTSSLQSMESCA
jgi:hypothetical protein